MSTNGGGAQAPGGSKRLAQQQAQVDEVVDIMRQNVDKVLERDKNLSLLDDRADKLQHNAAQFEQHAGKLKRKFWWKNMKMMIVMGIVGTIFAIVVIAWIASKVKAVTPALPASDANPSVNPVPSKTPGGAMDIPGEVLVTTKPHGRSRKKTTVVSIAGSTVATIVEDDGSSKGEDAKKAVKKRFVRATNPLENSDSVIIPAEVQLPTRRRSHSRKKPTVVSTNDSDGSSKSAVAPIAAILRSVRALKQ